MVSAVDAGGVEDEDDDADEDEYYDDEDDCDDHDPHPDPDDPDNRGDDIDEEDSDERNFHYPCFTQRRDGESSHGKSHQRWSRLRTDNSLVGPLPRAGQRYRDKRQQTRRVVEKSPNVLPPVASTRPQYHGDFE